MSSLRTVLTLTLLAIGLCAELEGILGPDGNVGEVAPETPVNPAEYVSKVRAVREEVRNQMSQLEMMQRALGMAVDAANEPSLRTRGMNAVQEMVEDIDNAHDFKTVGGFAEVLPMLYEEDSKLQAAAAWVVGTAAQNDRDIQLHLLELEAFPSLVQLLKSPDALIRAKALFSLSALVRNCNECWAAFSAANGTDALLLLLADTESARVLRKALVFVSDMLTDDQAPRLLTGSEGGSLQLCGAIERCLMLDDVDTQEKAVHALQSMVASTILRTGISGDADGAVGDASANDGNDLADSSCRLSALSAALRHFLKQCGTTDGAADGASEDGPRCDMETTELAARLADEMDWAA